jgi:hypothetical protein
MRSLLHRFSAKTGIGRDQPDRSVDVDLLVVAALFWSVSLVRVVGALLRHETFGAEATLALMAVIFTPWVVRRSKRGTHA